MDVNIKAIGKMVSSMEKENFIKLKKMLGKKEYGVMEKELDGVTTIRQFLMIILKKISAVTFSSIRLNLIKLFIHNYNLKNHLIFSNS
jgi:hypothetical protein